MEVISLQHVHNDGEARPAWELQLSYRRFAPLVEKGIAYPEPGEGGIDDNNRMQHRTWSARGRSRKP